MCGIAGIYTVDRPVDVAMVASVLRMLDGMIHRGPNDWGILVPDQALEDVEIRTLLESRGLEHIRTYPGTVSAPAAVLGSRRLSIIDLSTRGRMPLGTADGRTWITYNGEIYNHQELRLQLLRADHEFRTETDTETILAGYREWGESVVSHLRGMFAFAVLDAGGEGGPTLFLARDRFGIKPLYWTRRSGLFLLGSEVRSIMATGLIPAEPELRAINGFMVFGYIPTPLTTYSGVFSLPAANTLSMDRVRFSHPRPERYWSMPRPGSAMPTSEEAEREVRRRLDEAVRSHLVSDVPLGIFLSGGMDSSAITALAARHAGRPLRTLCVTFDDPRYSEDEYAGAVARRFGCEHRTVKLNAGDFDREMCTFLAAMDQPSVDGMNTFFVTKAAQEAGITVVLSGMGGDEVFWGYPGHRNAGKINRLLRVPGAGMVAGGLACLAKSIGQSRWGKLEFLRTGSPLAAYLAIRGLFPPREAAQLLGIGSLPIFAPGLTDHADPGDYAELEFSLYLQNQLLRDADVFGMYHSVEVRVPFLDHELVEYVAGLSADMKVAAGQGKPLLAAALRGELDAETIRRPKMGFALPFQEWFRDTSMEIRGLPRESPIVAAEAERIWVAFESGRVHWSRPWAVSVLSHLAACGAVPDWRRREGAPDRMLCLLPEVYSTKGGIPVYLQQFLRGVSEIYRGMDLHVVSLNDQTIPDDAEIHGRFHFAGCGPRGSRIRKIATTLISLWKVLRHRPGIIVCGHIHLAPLAYSLSRMTGAKWVLLSYGIEAWDPPAFLRQIALRCPQVISISRYTADRMVGWGINRSSIRILPNAVDGDAFRPLGRKREGSPFVLVSVARMDASERYKGVEAVIEAVGELAGRHPDLCYIVGGAGDDLPRLRRLVDARGLSDRISFPGYVPDDELPSFYSKADLFALPSQKEGFGFVFLEALACGVPVIAGNRDGSVEAVLNGKIGYLVDPLRADAVAECIEEVFESRGSGEPRQDPHFLRHEVLSHYGYHRFKERLAVVLGSNPDSPRSTPEPS